MYYSFTLIRSHSQDISFDHKSNEITYTYGNEKMYIIPFLTAYVADVPYIKRENWAINNADDIYYYLISHF